MHRFRRAALTPLCCLGLAACGEGIEVEPEPEVALPLGAASEHADELGPPRDEPRDEPGETPDPEAPETTFEAPIEAWPVEVGDEELAVIDDALFVGDVLFVAGRADDAVVVMRMRRGVAEVAAGDRFREPRAGASPVHLVHIDDHAAAMWLADGHLEAVRLDPTIEMASLSPTRASGEEGGRLTPPLVIASAPDGSGALACAIDELGPTCLSIDGRLSLAGMHVIKRSVAIGEPQALVAVDSGYMLVLGHCRTESCSRIDLGALALDPTGRPGKRRDLPLVQLDRGTAFVRDGDGFVLIARRVAAGEHSAWRVTPSATRELEGRFSRVVGGFAHDGETLLLERAHLRMRAGFPVRGYNVRPLTERVRGKHKSREETERHAIPEAIARQLPTDPDQRFTANGDALVFARPARKGRVAATVLRLP